MRNVRSLQDLQECINLRLEFRYQQNGSIYSLDIVRLLGLQLLEVMRMIKEKELYVIPD